jgi:hypothetical protein
MLNVPDKETQEIIDEMKAEGLPLIGEEKEEGDIEEPEELKAPTEPKETEPTDPPEPKEPKAPTDTDTGKVERPAQFMPLAKFNDQKAKWEEQKQIEIEQARQDVAAEYEKKIQEFSGSPDSAKLDDKIAKFAEEKGLDEEMIRGVVELVRNTQQPTIDPKVQSVISDLIKEKESKDVIAKHEGLFDEEVSNLQNEYPDEPISSIKDKLHDLAFSEGFNTKSLYEIYFRHYKPGVEKKKTFEPSKGGVGRTQPVDPNRIMDDPNAINDLSDEEFDKISDELGQKRTLKIRRAPK